MPKVASDLKVSDIKELLSNYGIETRGLKKCYLVELLKLIQNSEIFNSDTVENENQLVEETATINELCESCKSLESEVNQHLAEMEAVALLNEQLRQQIDALLEQKSDWEGKSRNLGKVTSKQLIKNDKNELINEKKEILPRVLLLCDSHGRGLAENLNSLSGDKYKFQVFFKPNATFSQIIVDAITLSNGFNDNDYLIVIGGTNDDNKTSLIKLMLNLVDKCFHTNLIISTIPYRYDKDRSNESIYEFNKNMYVNITNVQRYNANIDILDFNCGMHRNKYTRHGLHLNKQGKVTLSRNILKCVKNIDDQFCDNKRSLLKNVLKYRVPGVFEKQWKQENFRKSSLKSLDQGHDDNSSVYSETDSVADSSITTILETDFLQVQEEILVI